MQRFPSWHIPRIPNFHSVGIARKGGPKKLLRNCHQYHTLFALLFLQYIKLLHIMNGMNSWITTIRATHPIHRYHPNRLMPHPINHHQWMGSLSNWLRFKSCSQKNGVRRPNQLISLFHSKRFDITLFRNKLRNVSNFKKLITKKCIFQNSDIQET